MFYTDTNGQLPSSCNAALYALDLLMASKPVVEIDVEGFGSLALAIDAEESALCSFI